MAVRGYVLAKTGWTLEYINGLEELHLLFVYHHLKKEDERLWDRLGEHLGTVWDRETLEAMISTPTGSGGPKDKWFVPLSLAMNPELPEALLGKKKDSSPGGEPGPLPTGSGLNTEAALPQGSEVVNMGDLDRGEFLGLISNAGLKT